MATSAQDPNQDRSISGSDVSAHSEAEEKTRVAKIKRDIDIVEMSDAINCLRLEINAKDDYTIADSDKVEIAMNNVTTWRDKLSFIKNKFRDIQRATQTINHDVDVLKENKHTWQVCKIDLNAIVGETEAAIEKIHEEDRIRCLYSGHDKSKVTPFKYPIFSGSISQDYVKWEIQIRRALAEDQIKPEDKVTVVRSKLTGRALELIPHGIKDVEVLFSVLFDMYRVPNGVIKKYEDHVSVLGSFPTSSQVYNQIKYHESSIEILDAFELFPIKTASKLEPELSKIRAKVEAKVKDQLRNKINGEIKNRIETLSNTGIQDSGSEKLIMTVKDLEEILKDIRSDYELPD